MTRNKNRSALEENAKPPRELLPYEEMLVSKVNEKHAVTSNGRTEQLPLQEILIQKHIQTALSGSPHALNQVTKAMLAAEKTKAERVEYEVQFGKKLMDYAEIKVLEAIEAGENPNYVYPHPDDIVINHAKGWDILGIWNEEMLKRVKELEKFCEVLLWQHFLEERLDWPKVDPCEVFPNGTPYKGSAFLFLDLIQIGMPKRFQLGFDNYFLEERKSRGMSKRELLKHVRSKWQAIGYQVPRGKRMPSFKEGYLLLQST